MKRLLALLLVLVMCVGVLSGCDFKLFKKKTEAPAAATLEQAKDYLYNIMKDKNDKVTANDYDVIGKLIIDGTTFEITWKTDNASIVVKASNRENCWTIDIPDVNAAEVKYTLTATIKNEAGETIEVSFTPKLPVIEYQGIVTEPVVGVAYKLFFKQVNLGRTYYASNTTQNGENKFIEAKLDPKEAANFYVEVVEGGYKIYTEIDGVKNYVHATAVPKESGKGYTKCIGFATETDCVYTYDSSLQTFCVVIGGVKFGVGTYGTFETICLSELLDYFEETNIDVKDGQFPIRFIESAYAETLTPDVIPPHVHEYKDGYCDCGEKDPNATEVTTQAPILTATTLALGAYADGTKALVGVPFEYVELGTYGDGIQWRTKNGKSSSIWNTAATPLGIEKIEITLAEGKTGYSNTDALIITFGNAADALTYRTTLSTEKDVAKYTITPDVGTYTFFKMVHNFNNTLYVERITIYYTGGEAHEHEFVEGECACGESDPNYVPSHICVDADADYVCDDATCAKVVAPAADSVLTIEQALALGALYDSGKYTSNKYYVTGVIVTKPNATHGNLDMTADEKTINIYGLWDATGANKYENMAVKPVKGDTITVYSVVGQYNDKVQLKDAWVTAHTAHTCDYAEGVCTICGATDPNYVPTHDCVDADGDFICDETDCTKVVLPAADSVLTVEQALILGALYEHDTYTTDKYYITGVISNNPNATYGNLNLTDGEKTVAVYGLWDATGENRYDAMTVKPGKGDTITVYTVVGKYNSNVQLKNAWTTAHTVHTCEYVDGACTACGAVDPDAIPVHDEHIDADGDFICDVNNCPELVLPAADSTLTIEQALALGALYEHNTYTSNKYYVTGVIANTPNATHGNLDLTADGKTVAIYGLWDAIGENKYGSMAVKPVKGDTITVYTVIGKYNSNVQLKDAWTTEHTAHTCEFSEALCNALATCTTCGKTTGDFGDHNYVDGVCTACDRVENDASSKTELSVSKTHTDIAGIAGVTPGQNTGVIANKEIALNDDITIVCAKGQSTSDPCVYSESIRMYQGGATITVKAAEGCEMTTIVIHLASKSGGQGPITVTGGTASALSDYTYTITVDEGVSEVVITTAGTDKNNRLYVDEITVEYAK